MVRDYHVWDLGGSIELIKPGHGTVVTEFRPDDALLDPLRAATANGEKCLRFFGLSALLSTAGEKAWRVSAASLFETAWSRWKRGSAPEMWPRSIRGPLSVV
ncbi:hypothetical protein [Stenotrophomonas sp. PD6]|uniref:hypothetical protein n=1 Tax=Stenotrophomonas sp. PD6 TaxID=3368612 RepID=UPI003BA38EA2